MSGIVLNEVRRGFYLDSVALMRLSGRIAAMAAVEEAALMMGTPANKRIMADASLLDPAGEGAEGGDLVIAVRAETQGAATAALAAAQAELERPGGRAGATAAWRPRTLRAALEAAPESNLAFISLPGAFAAAEARKALHAGLHAMVFSDNVSLEDEVALKREARALGLLMMGPDCGTAILGGVPLGFANAVPRGDIGLIGSSGTGTQEVSSLIAQAGRGVSHAVGVGGRDLSQEVGGLMTLMALDALDTDPATRHIVIVSKPPSPAVAEQIFKRVAASAKTFTLCLVGAGDLEVPPNAALAKTLKAAAEHALGGGPVGEAGDVVEPAPEGRPRLCGLFAGGTLCAEAQALFLMAGRPVASNAPIPGAQPLAGDDQPHRMIDLGADEFTRGRPHPMIDPTVRDAALIDAVTASSVGIVLLDLVIGHGAHRDPAGHLARVLTEYRPSDGPLIIASVTGTDEDPQGRSAQIAALRSAGVRVAPTNADAAALALACLIEDAGDSRS